VVEVGSNISKDSIRRMADLLKSGATMLSITCPKDGTPLYRLKTGEVICPVCGTRYYVGTEDVKEVDVVLEATLEELEKTVLNTINTLHYRMKESKLEPPTSENIGKELMMWLDILEKIERIRKTSKPK